MAGYIEVSSDGCHLINIESVVLAPEKSLEEHGYIEAQTIKDSSHAKHEYHAMAQMAYFQHQDDELEIQEVMGPIIVDCDGGKKEIEKGMVLVRDKNGGFSVLIHRSLNKKKMLEAVYRYCTRWIRLDI